jgi:hypothetical protein
VAYRYMACRFMAIDRWNLSSYPQHCVRDFSIWSTTRKQQDSQESQECSDRSGAVTSGERWPRTTPRPSGSARFARRILSKSVSEPVSSNYPGSGIPGISLSRYPGSAVQDRTRKHVPARHYGSVLQVDSHCPAPSHFGTRRRESVLRTLGLRLWTPTIRADRQWGTIRCEVLPCSVPRTRNSEGLHNGLSSQTNGQVERYNRTILNALRGYVSERQSDWDEFTSAITFSYNCKLLSSLGLAPFELVLSRPQPPISVESSETFSESTPENVRLHFLHRLKELQPLAQRRLAEAQARYKAALDRSVREKNKELQPG